MVYAVLDAIVKDTSERSRLSIKVLDTRRVARLFLKTSSNTAISRSRQDAFSKYPTTSGETQTPETRASLRSLKLGSEVIGWAVQILHKSEKQIELAIGCGHMHGAGVNSFACHSRS